MLSGAFATKQRILPAMDESGGSVTFHFNLFPLRPGFCQLPPFSAKVVSSDEVLTTNGSVYVLK